MKDWKSTDAAGRLDIIEKHANDVPGRTGLIGHFLDKPADELKAVLGEPDEVKQGIGDSVTYQYHLGASNERKTISWNIDKWEKVSNAKFSWTP